MILRKPYAFLIKHFKLIHAILSVCMLYLLYQTYAINSFFGEFKRMGNLRADPDTTDILFNDYMFFIPWVVIVITIILLGVMIKKNKPKLYYLLNIASNIVTIALYSFLYNEVLFMETNIISGQEINLANDLAFMLMLVQLAMVATPIMRAIGLDLKKFDFGKDLLELEIDEYDNEEVEISVDFETNLAARKLNKSKRYLRYFYLENMFVINIATIILVTTIGYLIYVNTNIYSATYKQGTTFDTGDCMMTISNVYTTNKNSKGNVITDDDKILVILKTTLSRSSDVYFNTAKAQLRINGNNYYPVKTYAKKLADLGTSYSDNILTTDPTKYLLVYEIPKELADQDMRFRYLNHIGVKSSKIDIKYIKVDLNPFALEKEPIKSTIELNKEFVINEDVMGETKINIRSVEMAPEFIIKYRFCLTRVDCYSSVEHVKPLLNTNYDKALIKIDGVIDIDESMNIRTIKNIYHMINYFGKIRYVKDDKTYVINGFSKVESKKLDQKNVFYLEVDKNVLNADEVYLILNSRNREYTYTIKAKENVEG